ncbi:MAG: DNA-binding domain-containing protein, partial [Gammaproteobacteria bacterium]
SLRSLQERFAEAMFDPRSAGSELNIRANGLDGARRLRIYRNNIVNSFTEALRACYPVVDRLVGGRFFNHAARAYMRAYPSRSGDLREYGSALTQFLVGFAPAKALTYLPDVARLEWARQLVYHAPDPKPLDPSALGAIAPELHADLRFTLSPAARLLASPYPLSRIWQVNQADFEGDQVVDLGMGGVRLLIIRRGLSIEMQALGPGEYVLLHELAGGKTLGEAYEQAADLEPEFDLAEALKRHVLRQSLIGFYLQ